MFQVKAIGNRLLRERMVAATLAGGLRAAVFPKPGLLKKVACFATRYGSIDLVFSPAAGQPPAPTPPGIAHFLEHQLFKKPDFDVLMEFGKFGASSNAFTDYTTTTYYFSGTERFEESLDLLVRLVFFPHFADERVAREKQIIEQELRMYDDSPDYRLYKNLMAALYREHPVRLDIGGTVRTIQDIDRGLLERCYRRFYHPSNMWFVACGDLDPERVMDQLSRALSQGTFGSDGAAIERNYPVEPVQTFQRLARERAVVSRPRVLIGFKDLDLSSSRLLDRELSTSVLLDLLFGSTSAFHQTWYRQGLIDDSFSASYTSDTEFSFSLIGGETEEPDRLAEAVAREIRRAARARLKKRDIQRAVRKRLGRYLRSFDNPEGIAFLLLSCAVRGIDVFGVPDALKKLTVRRLEERLRAHLREEQAAVSIIEPAPEVQRPKSEDRSPKP
ncbi:MAG: insulinase family protein [Planctomycetes bacterium]|nr:insulinase family protein [Planctomycetota bacterium]